MNQGLYKLVFSKVLNMYVPASEAVRSHSLKSARRIRKHSNTAIHSALLLVILVSPSAFADTTTAVTLRDAVNAIVNPGATSTIVRQTAPKAIINWDKLNTAKGYLLQFDQQGNKTWSALNRIHDVDGSILNGIVKADGNVYFINANGILIGKDAQFNVGSLYAGTLDISDTLFNSGFINTDGSTFTEVFKLVGSLDPNAQAKVVVESGAQITTATNGKVLLFAPTVENSGIINTPDGQTILAAGKTIYLASSKDPAGFLVEVGGGGTATNLGKIVADRGNISMMGLAVNQAGTLSAKTSVRANGSIHLLAQSDVNVSGLNVTGLRNGKVTLAKGSVTEANPDVSDTEEANTSQAVSASKVKIEASLVDIEGTIQAKGGNVSVSNITDAAASLNSPVKQRIFVGDSAVIDVSGVNAVAPMSRNQLEIQLFSDQLKDAPILRDGGLFKKTVYVDARKGTPLFDIQPFKNLVPQTIAEKMTKAGAINLTTSAGNDVIVSKGSVLNVSGGSTTYTPGTIKETNLFYRGKLVPISEAQPNVPYDTIGDMYKVKDNKWGVTRAWDVNSGGTGGWGDIVDTSNDANLKTVVKGSFVNTFTKGDDAGTIDFRPFGFDDDSNDSIQNLVLAGKLMAETQVGMQQMIEQAIPLSGRIYLSANKLTVANTSKELPANFTFDQALPDATNYESVISANALKDFNRVDFGKVQNLTVNEAIKLKPNGGLVFNNNISSHKAQINADIIAPGSDISFKGNTTVADNVTISSAGLFTNDKTGITGALTQASAINAGDINANLIKLGNNVTLDASAGAQVNNKGIVTKGTAGDIALALDNKLQDNVTLKSYGFTQGGTLSLSYNQGSALGKTINVMGNPNASATDIDINKDFFSQGGFSKYAISGLNINIGDDTSGSQTLYTQARTLVLNKDIASKVGGQSISSLSTLTTLPDDTRKAVSFDFSATAGATEGALNLAENTTLKTDSGGSVSLSALKQVNVLGDISTPSGSITLKVTDKDTSIFDPTEAVYIGAKASLSAVGSTITQSDSKPNLLKTQVVNAGSININTGATKGAVIIKNGATLDVSATSIVNDTKVTTGYQRETLYGDAGSINITGVNGLLLDGDFKATATGTGRAGNLSLAYDPNAVVLGAALPSGSGNFTVTEQKQLVAQNFAKGDAIDASTPQYLNGQISAEQIEKAGFANVGIKAYGDDFSQSKIQLANGLDLNIAGNLKLDTPNITVLNDGSAKLAAGHINFTSPNTAVDTNTIVAGNGVLNTQSKQLYLEGGLVVDGVKQTNLNTSLDINGGANGGVYANGEINLTARQIYPTSGNKMAFEAVGSNSKIAVNSSGAAAKPVLSAAGTLSLTASDIVQNGVLSAPFGIIKINASNSATFSPTSITSISANNQTIPFGGTSTSGQIFNPDSGKSTPLPDKNISITAGKVDVQSGATLDLSGGGDVFASEWVPGLGGSQDVLSQVNKYAIIPSLGTDYAPTAIATTTSLSDVGKTVYLTGIKGLASGYYTLLPAGYALVPGAFLIETGISSKLLPKQTAPQLDGSTYSTGFIGNTANSAHDAVWSTFKVTDGAIFRPAAGTVSKAPSQYILTSANEFFSDPLKTVGLTATLPKSAGKLSLDANKLAIDGNVVGNKEQGAKGLSVDINSNNIRVVSAVGADDGSLQLTASSLNALKAESLLLGGTRTLDSGVEKITTGAQTVTIENDGGHAVNTPELIVAASNSVTVKSGAVVSTGAASATIKQKTMQASGDGALLALSANSDIDYSRTGSSASATQGDLTLEAGSSLQAGKSLVVDATNESSKQGNIALQDGGSATFGAKRILLGSPTLGTQGLNINAATFAALGQLNKLALNSYSNIDTYGQVALGNSQLNLTINAAGIAGHLAEGEVSGSVPSNAPSIITAKTLTLKNSQNAVFDSPADPSERDLQINATTFRLEGGDSSTGTQIAGYNKLAVNADQVRLAKTGESNFNVAETNINTGAITADSKANFNIKSTDKIAITKLLNAQNTTASGLGATVGIQATDLSVASDINVQSGKINLTATNNLDLLSGANINAKSTAITYDNQVENVNAGKVTLTSTTGNVNVNAGAAVDVTSEGNGDAGAVKIDATAGTANIAGNLKGQAKGAGKGGVLEVDVATLTDLTAVDSKANGFSETRQYRVRTGDVNISGTVANNNALTARQAIVSADAGKITVSGDVIATAPKNSLIGLYAGNGVTLESTANLQANASKAGEEGGKVNIYTKAGVLDLDANSTINVSGGNTGDGGKVHLRTARTGGGSGNGVAVASLSNNISGAQSVVLEAVRTFTNVTNITTGNSQSGATLGFTGLSNDVTSFMNNKDTIIDSLGKTGDTTFHLRAGTEVQSSASLTVGADWNLYSASRTGDEPGVLTLRAKDNITLNGSISDGFTTSATTAAIGTGDSWSYRIVAGADVNAANVLETKTPASSVLGNISLANNKLIRTGTGDIEIAAGGDLRMLGSGAAIYTVGNAASDLSGFDKPSASLLGLTNANYLSKGGDISINTKGNVVGAEPASGRQLINQWLYRQGGGTTNKDTSWWVRPDLFRQSLATLGGGDINIKAGGNISNFSASAATTGRYDTNSTTIDPVTGKQVVNSVVNGGGDVSVKAGGDINNGVYFVAKGDGELTAGGSIQQSGNTFGTVLAMQDGGFKVNAQKNIYIEASINPTLVSQATLNASQLDATGNNSYFNTYSTQSKVTVSSLLGDVTYGNDSSASSLLSRVTGLDSGSGAVSAIKYSPSTLSLVANQGSISVGTTTMLPSSKGDLKVLASNNVTLTKITMSDADPNALPNIQNPSTAANMNKVASQLLSHGSSLLHENDSEPVMIVAKNGDIVGDNSSTNSFAKTARMVAGNDVSNIRLAVQNNKSSDISLIKAGNDIEVGNVTVTGPGNLLVQAGRNIDLSTSRGNITATGNNENPALPSTGASITLQAGVGSGANVQGYLDEYILPTGTGPKVLQSNATALAAYRVITRQAVTDYMRQYTGNSNLSDAEALVQFNLLNLEAKTIFANRHLSTEFIASANAFAKAGNHQRGYDAIASLFPSLNTGDINLYQSKINTTAGGSIDMLAPGGTINVGLSGIGGDIGVITEKGGAIRAMVNKDFNVNQSKVITQFGSDITVWSTTGTIDAGRGSKTATSVPERIVQTDADGNTIIEVRGVAAGSGIRAQSYDPDGSGPLDAPKKGKVTLIAPIVDAGEAGIEAGDLLLVANIVLNAANIQVQGTSSGVPATTSTASVNTGAGVSPDAVNSATAAVAQSVANAASQTVVKPAMPSIISVDVISIGK